MDWFPAARTRGPRPVPGTAREVRTAEYYKNEKVRGEVFRQFGYFMTESTGHLSEYVPWFRKNREALDLYCDEPAFGGESGAYYAWGKAMAEKYAEVDPLEFEETACDRRSVEYCSWIMEAVVTGRPFRFMGNVYNDGYIDNLPRDSCVEVPAFADDTGIHPTRIGALPPQCAAACMTNVNVQQLTAEAALTGDPEHIVHALALNPLTAAVCTLREIREMATEMLEAQHMAARVHGTDDSADAHHQHSDRCRAGAGAARPGPGHSPAVRQARRAEDGFGEPRRPSRFGVGLRDRIGRKRYAAEPAVAQALIPKP